MSTVVKSRIQGEFHGWSGDGVYQLANGQVWQQVRYKYRYKYKYRPRAIVVKNGSSKFLHVDGMPEGIQVRRIV